jgi:hypothetical protein
VPNFDLSKYVDVAERIDQFYSTYPSPNGRIETELLNVQPGSQTQFIVRALVYLDEVCLATGLAEESLGGTGANKMAALENAETSAIGRALANMGFQTTRDGTRQRPSRQEMEEVNPEPVNAPLTHLYELLVNSGFLVAVQFDILKSAVGHVVKQLGDLTDEEIPKCIAAVESAIADEQQLQSEEEPF